MVLLVVVVLMDVAVLAKLVYSFRLLHFKIIDSNVDTDSLPTVSICITARNETHAMAQCLEHVVASDYPKLEVIVLDDGSRDDTSILIKSFAHAGVRFVEGKPLPEGWLGKNYAQSLLAREASGKLVFFMDVDTLIEVHTITRAVSYMTQHDARMISIVPTRTDNWRTSTLFATMRHFWTVIRFRPSRPRAAANAWMIDREILVKQFSENTSLPLSMQVETTIARVLAQDRKYRLVLSNANLGLRYEKRWSSQTETSIRLLYPQCDEKWYQVLFAVAVLSFGLVPYFVTYWQPWALAVIVFQYAIAVYYLSRVWGRYRFVGALLVPFILVQEIILVLVSAYRYKFGIITWKGRPITATK